eukprot:scaffold52444_cov60-Phaeocystis_antarctica.AAC.3
MPGGRFVVSNVVTQQLSTRRPDYAGGKRSTPSMQSLADPLLEPSGTIITDDERKAAAAKRKLLIGAGLCTGFMLIEVVGARSQRDR